MAAGIKKVDNFTELFNGQSDIVIFDEVADYNTATLSTIFTGGLSLGQIDGDTTEWTGDAPSIEKRVDEQGDLIVPTVKKGTQGFKCVVASTSQKMQELLLKAKKVTPPASLTGASVENITEITKMGEMPVMTRPIALIDEEGKHMMVFPKAKIVGNFNIKDKLGVIELEVNAEQIDTAELGTYMILKANPIYADGVAE